MRKGWAAVVVAAVSSLAPVAGVRAAAAAHLYVSSGQTIDGVTVTDFGQRPDVNDAGQIVYTGIVAGETYGDAVFVNSSVIAKPGTVFDGSAFTYTYAGTPRINEGGLVAFMTRMDDLRNLIVTVPTGPGGGAVTTYSSTVAGGEPLSSIGQLMLSNAGTVAWNTGGADGKLGVVTRDGFLLRQPTELDGVSIWGMNGPGRYGMNSAGTVVFRGTPADQMSTYLFSQDHKIVGTGSVVDGITLDWLEADAAINDAGEVAFSGYYGGQFQDIRGIFTTSRLVATNAGPIDGRTVTWFDPEVAINDAGQVAYIGNYENGDAGLFFENQLLAETGSVIDGRTVASLAVPAVNDAGLVVAYATFTDGSSGIITATGVVPEPGALGVGLLIAGGVGMLRRRRVVSR